MEEVKQEYGIEVSNCKSVLDSKYSAIILAVSHDEFRYIDFVKIKKDSSVLYDIKGFLNHDLVDARL